MPKVRMSRAKAKTLLFGTQGKHSYSWREIPPAPQLPQEYKRSFTRKTMLGLKRAGYIKFRPAQFYVTGAGRKALRDFLAKGKNDDQPAD